jgi:hypothetical protein
MPQADLRTLSRQVAKVVRNPASPDRDAVSHPAFYVTCRMLLRGAKDLESSNSTQLGYERLCQRLSEGVQLIVGFAGLPIVAGT